MPYPRAAALLSSRRLGSLRRGPPLHARRVAPTAQCSSCLEGQPLPVLLTFALPLGLTLRVVFSATSVPLGLLSAAPALLNPVHMHGLLQSAPGPVFVPNSGSLLSRVNVCPPPRYPACIQRPINLFCLGPAAQAAPLAPGPWRLFSNFSTLFRAPLHYVQLPWPQWGMLAGGAARPAQPPPAAPVLLTQSLRGNRRLTHREPLPLTRRPFPSDERLATPSSSTDHA